MRRNIYKGVKLAVNPLGELGTGKILIDFSRSVWEYARYTISPPFTMDFIKRSKMGDA